MIWFVIGLFAGATIGVFIMGIVAGGAAYDDDMHAALYKQWVHDND